VRCKNDSQLCPDDVDAAAVGGAGADANPVDGMVAATAVALAAVTNPRGLGA
jgi:hypothetical protein